MTGKFPMPDEVKWGQSGLRNRLSGVAAVLVRLAHAAILCSEVVRDMDA
jgi:hypothetical protein